MARKPWFENLSPLALVLIVGGVPVAIGAGYIGWQETESLLFTLLSAGLPAVLVLAGVFSIAE